MKTTLVLITLIATLTLMGWTMNWRSHAAPPSLGTPTVLYISYAPDGTRRCVGKERIGYRANPSCCPDSFRLVGIRMNGELADAVCLHM